MLDRFQDLICVQRVILDLNGTDPGYDGQLLRLMPVGSLKRIGDFRTAMIMLMQQKVVVANPGPTFDSDWYQEQAARLGLEDNLSILSEDARIDLTTLF